MSLWGIDLGGTKIEGVVLSGRDNPQIVLRKRIPTESNKGYNHILSRIKFLIDNMSNETGEYPKQIGFGTPGTTDPKTGLLKNSNTTCLNGKPLKQDLHKILNTQVVLANDANCFALAETLIGVVPEISPDAKVTFGVIMGTGVGGGIVVDGKIIGGRHGIGGEWGHNFLDQSGGACYCGKIGCVEKILSGKNLEIWHEDAFGEKRNLKEIYQAHLSGNDPNADATIDRLMTYFGKAMAVVINILDPDVVMLGGGVGNIDLLYTRGVDEVRKHVFNPELNTQFLKPKLGDSAGVFGAAFLVD